MINVSNLLVPSILFFGLGFFVRLVKSDLKFSYEFINRLSIYLIIGIGLHGGVTLRNAQVNLAIMSLLVALLLGVIQSMLSYFVFSRIGKYDRFNAAAVAAHYGSVSLGTFLTAVAFLKDRCIAYESYPTIMLAVMEVPSILIGVMLAKRFRKKDSLQDDIKKNGVVDDGHVLKDVLTNGSILLLMGSLLIGFIAKPCSLEAITPFFDGLFSGVLCLFLLGMGMEAAKRIHEVYKGGIFLLAFGVIVPLIGGVLGVLLGHYVLGFGVGGSTLVAVLGASASYIAAPTVTRMAIPEANPTLYLTLSLGITFPFNVTVGIPIYLKIAKLLIG